MSTFTIQKNSFENFSFENSGLSSKLIQTSLNHFAKKENEVKENNLKDAKKDYLSKDELKTSMHEALKKYFGLEKLKDFQVAAIKAIFEKKKVLVITATGTGKSLCYQLPNLMKENKDKFTLIISPLISLMKDQVNRLNTNLISSIYFGSAQSRNNEGWWKLKNGEYRMVYMSPEYAENHKSALVDLKSKIFCVAIDEAHCVSEWGNDFRPAFRKLACFVESLPGIPLICLTATCTRDVQNDLWNLFKFKNNFDLCIRNTVNRENIYYGVLNRTTPEEDFKDVLALPNVLTKESILARRKVHVDNSKITAFSSTLIYVNTRKEAENIAEILIKDGVRAASYHANKSLSENCKTHDSFLKDEVQVVVCTIAFGMGIDKADIRRIIHYGMPRSIEAYVQQSGRSGRDRISSECLMYINFSEDENKTKTLIIKDMQLKQYLHYPKYTEYLLSLFSKMSNLVLSKTCRREILLNYFGEKPKSLDTTIYKCAEDLYLHADKIRGFCCALPNGISFCANCDVCLKKYNDFLLNNQNVASNTQNNTLQCFSKECRIILRCIELCGGRTGAVIPCKIAIGSNQKKICKNNFDTSEVYGLGSYKPLQWWIDFLKLLKREGYVEENLTTYASSSSSAMCNSYNTTYMAISVSEKGRNFLRLKEEDIANKVLIDVPEHLVSFQNSESSKKLSLTDASSFPNVSSLENNLLKQLYDVRLRHARKLNVAPFNIAGNDDLKIIAKLRPSSIEKIQHNIKGILKADKTREFLNEICDIVSNFCKNYHVKFDVSTPAKPNLSASVNVKSSIPKKAEFVDIDLFSFRDKQAESYANYNEQRESQDKNIIIKAEEKEGRNMEERAGRCFIQRKRKGFMLTSLLKKQTTSQNEMPNESRHVQNLFDFSNTLFDGKTGEESKKNVCAETLVKNEGSDVKAENAEEIVADGDRKKCFSEEEKRENKIKEIIVRQPLQLLDAAEENCSNKISWNIINECDKINEKKSINAEKFLEKFSAGACNSFSAISLSCDSSSFSKLSYSSPSTLKPSTTLYKMMSEVSNSDEKTFLKMCEDTATKISNNTNELQGAIPSLIKVIKKRRTTKGIKLNLKK